MRQLETFHWEVAPGLNETAKPRVNQIQLGDGYEHRNKTGINNDLRTYTVTLNVRREEAQYITDFLTRHNGVYAFKWVEPNSHRLKTVLCETWSSTVSTRSTAITATFREVVA